MIWRMNLTRQRRFRSVLPGVYPRKRKVHGRGWFNTQNRKIEIEDGYDARLAENGANIRKLQSKKDKKKTERMGNRIESETAALNEDNRQLRLEAKELFKQNHVSAFCNSGFFTACLHRAAQGRSYGLFCL